MRIVFAGTPHVAVPTLDALVNSQHDVVGVITRPPASKGRSKRLIASPVGLYAKDRGLNVLETSHPSSENELAWIRGLNADLGVVVAYGALLRPVALESTRRGWVNLHFSALPDLRGAAPVQRALLRGDTEVGTTVFLLDPGMDSGPIITTELHPVAEHADSGTVLNELSYLGATQVLESLDLMDTPGFVPRPQETGPGGSLVTIAPKLSKQDGYISFDDDSAKTVNRIRAVTPAPGAWTLDQASRTMKLRGAQPSESADLQPGEVRIAKDSLLVGTSTKDVAILEVAPAGKTWMKAADWARGARLNAEDRLGRNQTNE